MRTETEGYLQGYIKAICSRAAELIECEIPELTDEEYLEFFKTGNRLIFEKQYFARREQFTIFGLAVVLKDDIEALCSEYDKEKSCLYTKRLLDVISNILDENTWVLPAHGSPEHLKEEAYSIDLFAAETAGSLSEILYLIKDNEVLKIKYYDEYESLCQRFFEQVRTRIFDVFFAKNPCDWWENGNMNWTSVCSGNIAICGHYIKLLKADILTEAEYEEIMDRVTKSMVCYLSSMGKDGVCTEGCGYYKYGMEYFLKFHELLNNEADIARLKKIGEFKDIALFLHRVYLGNGNCVNFADCSIKNKAKLGMVSYLSKLYDEVRLSSDLFEKGQSKSLKADWNITERLGGQECHRWLGAYVDYVWVKAYGGYIKEENADGSVMFPDSMWYIKKWSGNTAFYIKGGNNGESHNHNDIGSFGYIVSGEEMLCDLGVGEYTKEYFGDRRYDILCTGSRGHNIPVIAGIYQHSGKDAYADMFKEIPEGIEVSYLRAYYDEKHNIKESTYQIADKSFVKRKIIFNTTGGFEIQDSFKIKSIYGENTIITENFVSRIKPYIKENKVFINGDTAGIVIEYPHIEKDNIRIYIEEALHKEHDGTESRVYLIKADYVNNETVYIIDIKVDKL